MKFLVIVLLALLLCIAGPLAVIWALNTLFGLGIVYNIWSWLAVLVLLMFLRAPTKGD